MGMESLLPMGISLLTSAAKSGGGGGGGQPQPAAPPQLPPLPPTQRMPMPGSLTGMEGQGGQPSILDILGPMGVGIGGGALGGAMGGGMPNDLLSLFGGGGLNGR